MRFKIRFLEPGYIFDDLVVMAWHDYAVHHHNFDFPEQPDTEWLHKITVNYIRHNLTNYDHVLKRISDLCICDGSGNSYQGKSYYQWCNVIKRKALRQIRLRYPELERECEKQMRLDDHILKGFT